MDFGHGFIPRVGEENLKAIDRFIGATDLFNAEVIDLPWAIVDGAWASRRPELLATERTARSCSSTRGAGAVATTARSMSPSCAIRHGVPTSRSPRSIGIASNSWFERVALRRLPLARTLT
jgi:hypothetical protein